MEVWEQVLITCASSHWMGCPAELECSAKTEVAMSLLRTDLRCRRVCVGQKVVLMPSGERIHLMASEVPRMYTS